jgi:hypothetical protein
MISFEKRVSEGPAWDKEDASMSCTARLPLRTRQRAPQTERRSSRKTKKKKELGEDEDELPGRRRHLHFTDHVAQTKTHDNEQWTNTNYTSESSFKRFHRVPEFTGSIQGLQSAVRAKEEEEKQAAEDVDSK